MSENRTAKFRHHMKEVDRADKASEKREERLQRRRAKRARKKKKKEEEDTSESSPSGLGRCLGKAVRINLLQGFESPTLLSLGLPGELAERLKATVPKTVGAVILSPMGSNPILSS